MSAPKVTADFSDLKMFFKGIEYPVSKTQFIDSYSYPAEQEPLFARGNVWIMGLRIELQRVSWDSSSLRATVEVPDRNTGAPLPLNFDVRFDPCRTEEEMAEAIVKALANVIAHELAEMVFIRSERFDPHHRPMFFPMGRRSPAALRRSLELQNADDGPEDTRG